MIKSISIKGVTSFVAEDAVRINIDQKKVSVFYGMNGTGKTTIANYLQNQSGSDFSYCSVDFVPGNNPEFLVYNQQFIEENFLESSNQPGVFTLSKENKEAEQAIDDAIKEVQRLETDGENLAEDLQKIYELKTQNTDRIKEKVWKAKSKYEHTSLDYCLTGLKGSRKLFLEKVRQTPYEEIDESPEDLVREAKELQDQETTEKVLVDEINLDLSAIENGPLLQEVIVGSDESYLSQLIEKLGNSDWVQQGREYLDIERKNCPFCQQQLPDEFRDEVQHLFNEIYQNKLDLLNKTHQQYDNEIEKIGDLLSNSAFKDEYVTRDFEVVEIKGKLLSLLSENLAKITRKLASPSIQVELRTTGEFVTQINKRISVIRNEMELYNDKIKNRNNHLKGVKLRFWKIVRGQYQGDISDYENGLAETYKSIKIKTDGQEAIKSEIRGNRETISENRKKITNIELSIEHINKQLSMLGMEGFELVKEEEVSSFYRLKRGDITDEIYKSLSEGEKALITFLYFIELCQGSLKSDSPVNLANRIVVIDDPISSLSHNYVYEVASIIHHRIIEACFRQVFVLTHSLFFFHELLRLKNSGKDCPKDYRLFRVTKNTCSQVREMARGEIRNDYESFWQAIIDTRDGSGNRSILPNVMRNILEYYFSFIHQQESLKTALENLESIDIEFRPLFRYLNRQSHSDAINLTDFGEIEPEHFLRQFRKVFEKTGFLDHYKKMMGLEDE